MPAQIALINPRRRRKSRKARARRHVARRSSRRRHVAIARRRNPRRRAHLVSRRRRRAHNPRFSVGGITRTLIPAAIGGAGAVALDIALGYASPYLPAQLQSGLAKTAVKLAGAFALGMIAGKILGAEKGKLITLGGLTVVAYGAISDLTAKAAPALKGLSGATDFVDNNAVGAYMQPSLQNLGYVSPSPFIQNDGVGAYMQNDGM